MLACNRLGPGALLGEELLVHRKSRRADLVHSYQRAPQEFGILCPWLEDRVVVYEHYADVADTAALYLGLETLYALGRRRLRAPSDRPDPFDKRLADAPRPPLIVVVCRRMVRQPMVTLTEILPGFWTTQPDQDPTVLQMLVAEAEKLPDQPGTGLLRWIPMPRTDEERSAGIAALRGDPCLATVLGDLLLEDIMNENIPTSPGEPEEVRGLLTSYWSVKNALAAAEQRAEAAEAAKAAAEAEKLAAAEKAAEKVAIAHALRASLGDQLNPETERLLQALEQGTSDNAK